MGSIEYTRLLRADAVTRRLGLSDLRFKLEGENPTGSHKDRAAKAITEHAVRLGFSGVSVGTCGNMGVALARACRTAGLACVVFAPVRYSAVPAEEIAADGARLLKVEGSYEDAVEASELHAIKTGFFAANPIGEAGELAIRAYRAIAREVFEEVGDTLESVWIPIGNGTTFAGIHAGFVELGVVVRLGGVGSECNTAAITSMLARNVVELNPGALHETIANEPLVNWKSFHATEAIQALVESGGWACESTDEELEAASAWAFELGGVIVSPAGAAGLAGMLAHVGLLDPGRPQIAVLTTGREASHRR